MNILAAIKPVHSSQFLGMNLNATNSLKGILHHILINAVMGGSKYPAPPAYKKMTGPKFNILFHLLFHKMYNAHMQSVCSSVLRFFSNQLYKTCCLFVLCQRWPPSRGWSQWYHPWSWLVNEIAEVPLKGHKGIYGALVMNNHYEHMISFLLVSLKFLC